jgi:excisionase family DNA binding protein
MKKVTIFVSPHGEIILLCDACLRLLKDARFWPLDSEGMEYAKKIKGPTEGKCGLCEAFRKDILTPQGAADLRGVSKDGVYKAIRRGKIPPIIIGGRIFVERQEIEAYLERIGKPLEDPKKDDVPPFTFENPG